MKEQKDENGFSFELPEITEEIKIKKINDTIILSGKNRDLVDFFIDIVIHNDKKINIKKHYLVIDINNLTKPEWTVSIKKLEKGLLYDIICEMAE